MCIRDSLEAARQRVRRRRLRRTAILLTALILVTLFATGAVGASIARVKDMVDTVPVSYTHLDVYKRQG